MSTRVRRNGRAGAPPEGTWRGGKPTLSRRARNDNEAAGASSDVEVAASSEPGGAEAERRGLAGNRYLEMKDRREEDKNAFINAGLMNDPYKAVSLKDAITMVGTCMDMCPELERHEREFQNNVDKWEAIDPDAKPRRIDHVRAVKAFQRATQGTEPIPSDLRPLPVLQRTADYLFHTLLGERGLEATHEFIWDRTRAIRREFTIQRLEGPEVADVLERIARYHALCLFRFSHLEESKFSIKHEREQLDKSLQSLVELYDDAQGRQHFPNEAEFRAFRQSRQAFYAAFDKIRASKTAVQPGPTDPSDMDIIDGFYQPTQQTTLPPPALSGIPMHGSLGAAPGAYVAKPRPGPIETPYSQGPVNGHAAAMPPPPVPAHAFAGTPNGFGALSSAAASTAAPPASVFGTSSVFGKGAFGAQPQAMAPAFSAFAPNAGWSGSSTPAAPAQSAFGGSSPGTRSETAQSTGTTEVPTPFSGFPSSESATKPSSLFPPANLFSNVAASTSTPAPPSWSSSASPWATNPLFSGFKSSAEPSVGVDATQPEQPQWSQGEGEASFAEAKAAVAAAAAEAAEEAARDKFEAEAAAKAEQERLRRRQQQEESERREHTLKEQLRVRVVEDRQRAEVERARRAAEAEAEADRLAQEELAAVAEMARRQAVADAFSAKMAEEMMRRAEQPLIAERWHRARVLQKMWARWKERALEVALLLEQEEALKQRREQFKASVKDLMASSGTASPRRNGTPRARTHSATPVTDAERARTLEDESKKHAKLWAFGSFIGGLRNLIGNVPLWEVWLCPASSDGASSAWLKTKFGIDQDRANDAAGVHRIQVFEDISKEYFTSPSSPGLVVFEMSADVQVDCRRLNKMVSAFPANRHYAVSLLLVKFSGSEAEIPAPLKDLIQSLGKAGVLADARALVLTASNDMDKQFVQAATSLKLDLAGTLVQRVSLDAFVGAFTSAWEISLNTWIGLCTDSAGFNWPLYGAVLSIMFSMLNEVSHRIALAAGKSKSSITLPAFDWGSAADTQGAFEAVIDYLALPALVANGEAELLRAQLSDAASAGAEFPVYALPERIGQIVANAARNTKGARHVYLAKDASADSITAEFRGIMQGQLSALDGMIRYIAPSRAPSPSDMSINHTAKKRSVEEMEWDDDSNFVINSYERTNGHANGAAPKRYKTGNGSERMSPPSPALSTVSLMSTSSVGGSRRGAKLRALMDRMRASLRGEEEL